MCISQIAREPRAYDSRFPLTTTSFREPVMSSGKSSKISLSCLACSKPFLAFPSVAKSGRRYCSLKCYNHRSLPSLIERFWSHVVKTEGCWLWNAKKLPKGYGLIRAGYGDNRTMILVHRLSWEIRHSKQVPEGYWVLHACDNPSCVNPDHLFLGKPKDNTHDMIKKGRQRVGSSPGAKNGSAKLTQSAVDLIRVLLQQGEKCAAIAAKHSISINQIYRIKANQSWVR